MELIYSIVEQSDKVYSQIVLFLQVAADKDTWSEESRRGLMGTLSLCEFLLENSKEKDVLIKALSGIKTFLFSSFLMIIICLFFTL